jgi:integrase
MAKVLTDISIRNLKPGAARREIPDGGQRGLYVIVQPSGRIAWAVRYRFAGVPRKLTLQAGLSLAAARKVAGDAMFEVDQGRDPGVAKQAAKLEAEATKQKALAASADTFQSIAEEYLSREGPKLRTLRDRRQMLERLVYPTLGGRQIDSIGRLEIARLLDRIADHNGARMSDIVLSVIRRVMNWHAVRSDTFRSPIVRGMGGRDPHKPRERILSDDELRAVWAAAEQAGHFGALIKFLLLTGARRGEAAAMRWSEIDGALWALPAERNKTAVALVRPLSRAALAVLAELPRISGSDLVFTFDGETPMGGFSRRALAFNRACGVGGWVLHDLRRTARSLLSRAGVRPDIAERALGHVVGTAVARTYDRHTYIDELQHAYEALAAQIDRIVDPQPNVTAIRRGATT